MSTLLGIGSGIIDAITGVIGRLLYPMFSIVFVCISTLQNVFYSFAGIDNASYDGVKIGSANTGAENDTGLLYFLMNNGTVKNILMSIMLLALFLVIIFTVMAFLKNVYAAKPKNWKEIIGNSIKGLANFIFLPVCCLLGVWLGNILLQAINGATSPGQTTSMDRKLFIAAAYNANEFRNGVNENAIASDSKVKSLQNFINSIGSVEALFGSDENNDGEFSREEIMNLPTGKTNGYYADVVDFIYANSNISIRDTDSVERWYSLFDINYLVIVVGGVFMLYVLGSLAFAMVRRIFILLTLFIISPGVCALYPLDEGNAVKEWSKQVKSQVLSAYGAVAGVNIFFALTPIIDNISIFAKGNYFLDDFVQIFIFVTGLLCVKELITMISGFVGGEDAYNQGKTLMSNAKKATIDGGKKAMKWGGVFTSAAVGSAKWTGRLFGAVTGRSTEAKLRKKTKQFGNINKEADEKFGSEWSKEKEQWKAEQREKHREKWQGFTDKMKEKESKQAEKEKKQQVKAQKRANRKRRLQDGTASVGDIVLSGLSGAKNFIFKDLAEESGLKKSVTGFTDEFVSAMERHNKRVKADQEGSQGENKVLEKLNKNIGKTSSHMIEALDKFADKVVEGVNKEGGFKEMGLVGQVKTSDVESVNNIVGTMNSFMSRFNSTTDSAVRKELLDAAKKFAASTNPNGNEKVQAALNEMLTSVTNIDINDIDAKIKFEATGAIKELEEASKKAGEAMATYFEKNMDSIVKKMNKDSEKH